MCGLFGLVAARRRDIRATDFNRDIRSLFKLSRKRGRDASGIASYLDSTKEIGVVRHDRDAKYAVKHKDFDKLMTAIFEPGMGGEDAPLAAIGHCRLATHGSSSISKNNQPIVARSIIGIHNGIITNAIKLSDKILHPSKKDHVLTTTEEAFATETDSQIFYDCLNLLSDCSGGVANGLQELFSQIEGHASIALFTTEEESLFLGTNTGSLYIANNPATGLSVLLPKKSFSQNFSAKASCSIRIKTALLKSCSQCKQLRFHLPTAY